MNWRKMRWWLWWWQRWVWKKNNSDIVRKKKKKHWRWKITLNQHKLNFYATQQNIFICSHCRRTRDEKKKMRENERERIRWMYRNKIYRWIFHGHSNYTDIIRVKLHTGLEIEEWKKRNDVEIEIGLESSEIMPNEIDV